MKRIVLTYGGIAGAIVVAMMYITIPLYRNGVLNLGNGEWLGYTTMVIAMSMIFFGVKSYRDHELNGAIKFGKAFQVGALIAGVASIMYVVGWEINLRFFNSDFMESYVQFMMKNAVDSGATPEKLEKMKQEFETMKVAYQNIFLRMGLTLMEILPVGVLIALITAAVLRKKEH